MPASQSRPGEVSPNSPLNSDPAGHAKCLKQGEGLRQGRRESAWRALAVEGAGPEGTRSRQSPERALQTSGSEQKPSPLQERGCALNQAQVWTRSAKSGCGQVCPGPWLTFMETDYGGKALCGTCPDVAELQETVSLFC